ncbi:hypothetical protein AMAG_09895 [Allomyces macrogynus ATCC 38327]|uniref:BHLH domain-containing protein n=1 Tax=Allomyces macrogynus (strain ATCC 38327) TaxID=578462 RepID=A0A0L0SQB8_ALLM3|nr:hypothetical protein AMAG_09895 [Allomyces macrogynus ATCC 38327]|eukprot:KNE64535.1 hypothetical protein AMAG_09895 [Allomyces macrogynus ATCC 38327]
MTTPPSATGPALLSADEQRRLSEFLAHMHDPTAAPAPAAPPMHAEHLAHPLFLTDSTAAAPASIVPGLPLMAPLPPPPPPAVAEPAGNKRRSTTDAASASRVGKEKRARTASAPSGPSTDAAAPKKSTKRAAPKRARAVSATTADAMDASAAGETDGDASGSAATASGRKSNRVLLTDEVKKRNHIASEQKRRQNIRHGFDLLMRLVPGLAALPRSESVILHRTTAYLQQLLDDHARLKRRAIELQVALGELPPETLATARPDEVSEDDEPVTVPVIVPLDEPAGGEETANGGTVAAVVPAELPPIKIRTYRRTVYNNNKRRRKTSDEGEGIAAPPGGEAGSAGAAAAPEAL